MGVEKKDTNYLTWTIVILIMTLVLYVVGRSIYIAIKNSYANRDENYKPGADGGLSQSDANNLADNIYANIGLGFYTRSRDSQLKKDFARINSDADFKMVKDAFGYRDFLDINPFKSVSLNISDAMGKRAGGLLGRNSVSQDLIDEINTDFQKKGITYHL